MSEPFTGQLMLASFNFAPKGWAMCNGKLMAINQNQALFSLLGTTYGGDGRQTFGLPNLQGRTPVGFGNSITPGQLGGEDLHTVNISELPAHTHTWSASAAIANLGKPNGALVAGQGANLFTSASNLAPMNQGTLQSIGASQPHENRQPFLVMNWCIALQGLFPTRN
jgi:microcystin-dependent protein